MNPQALAKLDLLAAAKEAALLDSLNRHNAALQRYAAQREVLASYQERLGSLWRGGAVVRAADAIRAGQFSNHAEAAVSQLIQALAAEQAKQTECVAALAELRARRRLLQERLDSAMRLEKTIAEERAARDLPHLARNIHGKTETIA
ncbi:MAG: hypothetical protein KGQ79_00055 [Proteobacteria bacterium]|nr:hypothetical protein [Pseudomonadota bacterium]MBU6425678.1 hypothetical protein [Rhodospirillales bacterium]